MKINRKTNTSIALCLVLGCGDPASSSDTDDSEGSGGSSEGATTTATTSATDTSSGSAGGASSSSGGDETGGVPADCDSPADYREEVVCAAEAFMATLDADQQAAVLYDWTDDEAKTYWSNLPGVERNGLTLGELDDESRAAALGVAQVALSEEGYEDYIGLLAADDYLATLGGGGGGGPGGGAYGSDNYVIAFIGTPSVSDDWMLQLGGHHMAFNITYAEVAGATPNHQGAEPKGEFMIDGESYAPLEDDGEAMFDVFEAMDAATLSSAQISGSFGDVVLGPVEYGSGSYDAVVFPTGADREGVLVSTLTADEQELVSAAIQAWVGDYPEGMSGPLMASYTSEEAFADTYVGWAGSGAAPDREVNGTYLRIDGPEIWIELVCQNGVLIQGQTHYHAIYRDKNRDYGGSL